MDQDHLVLKENLAAYALGALDAQEISALRAHLQTCDECRAELADYQRVGDGLLLALPPQAPRQALRRNLQKRLSAPARPTHLRPGWSFSQMAMAGGILLLLGLNIFSVFQVYSLRVQQNQVHSQYDTEQTAIAMLAYPSTQSIGFEQNGVSGSLLVDKNRDLLAIFAWHLPPPPAGKTYQMWLIDPQGDRTRGGFLIPEADQPFAMQVIKSPQPLTGFVGFGITIEPLGGSPKPTGEKILRVDF